jgi:uncharacterized LabA/DUF88 family protein
MRRVVAYIDGFNLYHAIDELKKPHLKWLDLFKLSESICGKNETLTAVYYFTAYATWLPGAIARHKQYVAALTHAGVTCVIGHFKQKERECLNCRHTWVAHEEKETDVAIAIHLVADVFRNQYERALIISADSDLAPAIRMINKYFPQTTVNVIAPPNRFGHARDLKPIRAITPGQLARCLLPETALAADGSPIFRRPESYHPPN